LTSGTGVTPLDMRNTCHSRLFVSIGILDFCTYSLHSDIRRVCSCFGLIPRGAFPCNASSLPCWLMPYRISGLISLCDWKTWPYDISSPSINKPSSGPSFFHPIDSSGSGCPTCGRTGNRPCVRSAPNRHRVAEKTVSRLLATAQSEWQAGPSRHPQGSPSAHPGHVAVESNGGITSHCRRAP